MGNLLTAIQAIVEHSNSSILESSSTSSGVANRANQMGDALEDFVKAAFANCIGQDSNNVKMARNNTFSYLGNSNNPPDAMLKNGDAIEIKKLESLGTAQLQLNSSYPKNKLHSDNPKLCRACVECENWTQKDMLYVIGHVERSFLRNVFFIYGDLYCDAPEIYKRVETAISDGLNSLDNVQLSQTNELGRVNKVDHLGISDLRIRGMWLIKSPFLQFKYLIDSKDTDDHDFKLCALIPEAKYQSFEGVNEFEDFSKKHNIKISTKQIEDPQNPARLITSKLIIFTTNESN